MTLASIENIAPSLSLSHNHISEEKDLEKTWDECGTNSS